jgi:hypothetical protein
MRFVCSSGHKSVSLSFIVHQFLLSCRFNFVSPPNSTLLMKLFQEYSDIFKHRSRLGFMSYSIRKLENHFKYSKQKVSETFKLFEIVSELFFSFLVNLQYVKTFEGFTIIACHRHFCLKKQFSCLVVFPSTLVRETRLDSDAA